MTTHGILISVVLGGSFACGGICYFYYLIKPLLKRRDDQWIRWAAGKGVSGPWPEYD